MSTLFNFPPVWGMTIEPRDLDAKLSDIDTYPVMFLWD